MFEVHPKDGLEIWAFSDRPAFYSWLAENHTEYSAIWIKRYKKASDIRTISWPEIVEVCLCFGWIDGVVNGYNEDSFLQRLTPRRSRSIWSKINRENVERLVLSGEMQPAGLAQVEAAKADGRWMAAYDSPKNMKAPDYFLDELALHPKALETYQSLKKSPLYSIHHSLATAKREETKLRRVMQYIEKLEAGETSF